MKLFKKNLCFFIAFCSAITLLMPTTIKAATQSSNPAFKAKSTHENLSFYAIGSYSNWDGVSNVDQFRDKKGNFYIACDVNKKIHIYKYVKRELKDTITISKKYALFGGVTCDDDGNFYVVTGKNNTNNNTNTKTIFISKYDSHGKHIKTVGDNGSASLASYYNSSFHTKEPFHAGNCDVAINGDILSVNYGRKMYSGHQSNSVFAINIHTMKKISLGAFYESHSFAQRTLPYKDGFLFASEGDCYSRAFTIYNSTTTTENPIFHFWVKKNTLTNWDMYTLNNNFAHMGGISCVDDTHAALVGTSAKALNTKAATQNEQLFIQIFNPQANLSEKSAYYTTGKRSGLSGGNGDETVTDYGVKWLTSYSKETTITNPQVVSNNKDKFIIFYEKYKTQKGLYTYKGIYSVVLDKTGTQLQNETLITADYHLNPSRMPVYSNGYIFWAGNKDSYDNTDVYMCRIAL